MRVDGNMGGAIPYDPNSYGEWREQPEFAEPPLSIEVLPITGIIVWTRITTRNEVTYSV
jgi:hypothetical protein